MIRVLLIEDNPGDITLVSKMLAAPGPPAFHLESAEHLAEGVRRLSRGGIDVLLLDLSLPDSTAASTFDLVRKHAFALPIVLLTGLADERVALELMQAGAQDYLNKGDIDSRTLSRALRYAVERHRQSAAEPARGAPRKSGKIISFLGAKGGVGVTTLALNVAASLAQKGCSTIALELRPNRGTFGDLLKHSAVVNLASLLHASTEDPAEKDVSASLVRFPTGLKVLFGPQAVEEYGDPEIPRVQAILHHLTSLADYLLIDLPCSAFAPSRVAASQSDLVCLVTDRDPVTVECAAALALELRAWGVAGTSTGLILVNRSASTLALSADQIGSRLGFAILGGLTSAPEICGRAAHLGLPFVLSDPDSSVGSAAAYIASKIHSTFQGQMLAAAPAAR